METLSKPESSLLDIERHIEHELIPQVLADAERIDEVLEGLKILPFSRNELRSRLDNSFVEAVVAQEHALSLPSYQTDKEEVQKQADFIAFLAGREGIDNKDIPNIYAAPNGKGKYPLVRAVDYKKSQYRAALAAAETSENNIRREAIIRAWEHGFSTPVSCLEDSSNNATLKMVAADVLTKNKEKIIYAGTRMSATIALSTIAITAASGSSAAAMKPDTTSELYYRNGAPLDYLEANGKPVERVIAEDSTYDRRTSNGMLEAVQNIPPEIGQKIVAPLQILPIEGSETIVPEIVEADPPQTTHNSPIQIITAGSAITPEIVEANPLPGVEVVVPPVAAPAPAPSAPETPAPAPAPESAPVESPGILAARGMMHIKTSDLPQEFKNGLPDSPNWENTGRMIEYLMIHGELTEFQALGVVANAMWESAGVNPGQEQIGGPAFGIVQWEGGRRTALEAFAVEQNRPVDDLYLQLDFMLMELKRDAWNGYAELKAAKDSKSATIVFVEKFERPGEPHVDNRLVIAHVLTELYTQQLAAVNEAVRIAAEQEAARIAAEEEAKRIADAERERNNESAIEVSYFYQLDERWAGRPMSSGNPIGRVACAPTSLAMVAATIGNRQITPNEVYDVYLNNDTIGDGGAHQQTLLNYAPQFGLEAALIPNNDINLFRQVIKDGGLIIFSGNTGSSLLINPGHFVVVRGITDDGLMLVADPGNPENNSKTFSLQDEINRSEAIRAAAGTTDAGLHYSAVALYPKK